MPNAVRIPGGALVLLIGASGSGKSTFAARHFAPGEVISSDRLRQELSGDEGEQRATDAAFRRLHRWLEKRLATGALAVVDATNVEWTARGELIRRAREQGRPAVAIVFDLPLQRCLARNAARPRSVRPGVVRRQHEMLRRDLDRLDLEGFQAVHLLRDEAEVEQVAVEIEKGPVARAPLRD